MDYDKNLFNCPNNKEFFELIEKYKDNLLLKAITPTVEEKSELLKNLKGFQNV